MSDDVLLVHLLEHLADPGYRQMFRQPAQDLARQYDVSRNLSATLALFDRVMA